MGLIISLENAVTGSIVAEVVRLRFLPFRPVVSRLRLLLAFRKVMTNARLTAALRDAGTHWFLGVGNVNSEPTPTRRVSFDVAL
jgi:hypothetical protein